MDTQRFQALGRTSSGERSDRGAGPASSGARLKSDRPSGAHRLVRHEQPIQHRFAHDERDERRDDDDIGQPPWLERWLEAEEEIYSLPCTD